MKRIKDALIGFSVGDALGVPVEFTDRSRLIDQNITTMLGNMSHNVEKDGTVPYAALYNCMPNVQQCTIRANALGDDVYKTATLVAQITRKDGKVIEARQKVHVEGLFTMVNTSGNDINKTLDVIYEETVTIRVHPNRVNSYTMKSLDPSKIKVTKVNFTDYKISCDPSVELGVPYSVLATSEAGQEYSISVSCFVI